MRIWKKALSGAMSATLLASLLGTAFATSVFAVAAPLTCAVATTTSPCAQVADGASQVRVDGVITVVAATDTLYVASDGVKFVTAAGGFAIATGGLSASLALGADLAVADKLTLTAPVTAGTSTLEVYTLSVPDAVTGYVTRTSLGTMTISWTSTFNLDLSVAGSTVKVVANGAGCAGAAVAAPVQDKSADAIYDLCVRLKDANGNLVANTANVSVVIGPVGLVNTTEASAGNAQAANENTVSGDAVFGITGSGIANTATIQVFATYRGTSYNLPSVTVVFSGAVASVTATNEYDTVLYTGPDVAAVGYTGKDSAGNAVAFTADSATSSNTAVFTIGAITAYGGNPKVPGTVAVNCVTFGTATVTVKEGTLSSNAITVICSGLATSFSVAFSAASVTPGGTANIVITMLDTNGLLAADAPGALPTGILSAGAMTAFGDPDGYGTSSATFLAPFNTGVATALVSVPGITGSKSAQINVGAVIPAVTSGTNASALGATKTGTYTTATKIAALGKYQTFKISFGAGAAGTTVGILVATKNSAGVWSSFTRLTGRVADSAGDAYFWWYSPSAAWISVQGDVGGTLSNAVQGRWR